MLLPKSGSSATLPAMEMYRISEKRKTSGTAIAGMIFLLGCVLILVSCNIISGTTSTKSGEIFEKLQKEVPFTIVVPTYLPKDISHYPSLILGPGKTPSDENSVMVGFGYSDRSNTKYIRINEENREVTFYPSRPSSVYFDIRGTRILEEPTESFTPSQSPSKGNLLPGFLYGWNHNGVNFKLTIYGYGTDEGRKIVESMLD